MLQSSRKRKFSVPLALAALATAGTAQARPLTTRPELVVTVRVTITDARIVLSAHSAPRGVAAHFVISNAGAKVHNFTLNGPKSLNGARQGFSRTVKPGRHASVGIFLDVRARETYFGALPGDRRNPGVRGLFVIR